MRQWGIGLASYAASNKGFFPPNTDAVDMSWIGQAMIDFSGEYLGQKLDGFTDPNIARENQDHVMYCPTQEWHRWYREHNGWSPGNPELVGYFYLPFRAIPPENPSNGADYTPAGLSWVDPAGPSWPHDQAKGKRASHADGVPQAADARDH